jgi:methyltransferase (TIGR00027 family)|nr:class I SAM-dependent methyltransferase [Kofleriaceae bacterium]
MGNESREVPENTAERVALWRALHAQIDAPPHVVDDTVGLRLLAPPATWTQRPDMDPTTTRSFRAGIVSRARFVEDTVGERAAAGVDQYVILGAGLDTFAQRRPELASRLHVFEIDQAGPQAWKRRRLAELGYPLPDGLRFVPVDFEATGGDWRGALAAAGFDAARPAVVSSLGVSMYLTREAIVATLKQAATLARGSTFVMTFLWPVEDMPAEVQPAMRGALAGARTAGVPFISFFTPPQIMELARAAGFHDVAVVAQHELARRYFAGRGDGLAPADRSEDLVVATV